jgi:diacylglycerol kinase family enzyme
MVRTFFSVLVRGSFARRVFRRFEGDVRVDGNLLPRRRFVGVGAATVREVGLGFKLNHRADDDPERFGVLAIHSGPLALVADLRAVHDGRGVAASRAFSAVASTLELEAKPSNGDAAQHANQHPDKDKDTSSDMSYTIDGDLYTTTGPLRISVGPPVLFVKLDPAIKAQLGPVTGPSAENNGKENAKENRNTRLIEGPGGDTMSSGR